MWYRVKYSASKVLKAVKKNGLTLKHASEDLQNNRMIAAAAVEENGEALAFAASIDSTLK